MNIILITNQFSFNNTTTGRNDALVYLAKSLVQNGHSVYVILNDLKFYPFKPFRSHRYGWNNGEENYEYIVENAVTLLNPIQTLVPFAKIPSPISYLKTMKRIRIFISKYNLNNPDLVLMHFGAAHWMFLNAFKNKIHWNLIYIFHHSDTLYPKQIIRKMINESKMIGVRSQAIHKKLNSIYKQNVPAFQVFSGIPDNYIKMSQDKPIKYSNTAEPFKLLYVGKLIPRKNVDTILQALVHLKNKYMFTLEIIGDGEMYDNLVSLSNSLNLTDRVTFYGKRPRSFVLSKMLECDCFSMVSSSETLGVVYMEALGCGCFVIGSKGEGIDGVIINKENGLLVQPGNIDELCSAFEYYFTLDDVTRDRIMQSVHNTAEKHTESEVAKKYVDDALCATRLNLGSNTNE